MLLQIGLEIADAKMEDAGLYACHLTNEVIKRIN